MYLSLCLSPVILSHLCQPRSLFSFSLSLAVWPCLCLSVSFCICLCLSVSSHSLCLWLSVCFSLSSHSLSLSLSLSLSVSLYLSVCLSLSLSVCLSLSLLSFCLSLCLSLCVCLYHLVKCCLSQAATEDRGSCKCKTCSLQVQIQKEQKEKSNNTVCVFIESQLLVDCCAKILKWTNSLSLLLMSTNFSHLLMIWCFPSWTSGSNAEKLFHAASDSCPGVEVDESCDDPHGFKYIHELKWMNLAMFNMASNTHP